ncbi:MAG: hypothetical protein IJ955_05110 [Oscillospiraceae bacterium]|nr:hypothetical protein [Oscillospiraceae bacterium]
MSNDMNMDKVLAQLSSINPPWQEEVEALETAISILSALQDEGIHDAEQVRDMIHDYRLQATQLKECHRKYQTAAKAVHHSSIYLCPDCNHRVAPKHTHCHWCGKKLGGW